MQSISCVCVEIKSSAEKTINQTSEPGTSGDLRELERDQNIFATNQPQRSAHKETFLIRETNTKTKTRRMLRRSWRWLEVK
jgi:hypothetical protein